jgi:leader peptidase (prepilin peptidase)/N-methyltransferase
MNFLIILFFGIFGVLIGSFLNVVIFRFNTGKGLGGRSGCTSCGKTLKWYELVPVLSYVVQKGKCTKCKSKISAQYPLIEILTGILFALIAERILVHLGDFSTTTEILNLTIAFAAVSVLIVIFVYDYRHKIIPDFFSYLFAALALARLLLFYHGTILYFPYILDLLAGPLVALPFFLVWYVSKGRWMGLGDAKLALGIGWFLGFAGAISALCLAFWIGAIVGISMILLQGYLKSKHRINIKSEIPFAPFIIIGFLVVYFFPMDLFNISTLLYFL